MYLSQKLMRNPKAVSAEQVFIPAVSLQSPNRGKK